jgi:hypothetical protein
MSPNSFIKPYVTLSICWLLCCHQVAGLGALVVTPVVGNLSDRYGRKALLALPAMASIVPLGTYSSYHT